MDYTGGRTTDTIVQWVQKKTGPPSTVLTCDELKTKVEAKDVKAFLVYFGPEDNKLYTDAHLGFANTYDKLSFYHVTDSACSATWSLKAPSIGLFKTFDDPVTQYSGAATKEELETWTKANVVPTVFEFSEDDIENVFGNH